MSINISSIVAEFGAYYENAGQNKSRILRMLTQGREFTQYCTPMKTDDTIFRLSNASFNTLVQPFQKAFTQKGGVTIVPNEIRVFHHKIDDEFYPDDIKASWLGFLAMNNVNREEWPLVKWMVEEYYRKQIDRDMELLEYFNGVYAAPSVGVAGVDGTGMDGIKKLLQAGVDASTINSVDIGALAPVDRHVEGVVEMVLDATANCQAPVTRERLFGWHAALFPTGYSGLSKIKVGGWRDDASGPMQVVSGPIGRQRVHFEAQPAERMEAETSRFLDWLNGASNGPPLIKAGLGHLWFVTLHPFDDGNGRIARAIGDLLLARADGSPQRRAAQGQCFLRRGLLAPRPQAQGCQSLGQVAVHAHRRPTGDHALPPWHHERRPGQAHHAGERHLAPEQPERLVQRLAEAAGGLRRRYRRQAFEQHDLLAQALVEAVKETLAHGLSEGEAPMCRG